ncbi:MAG: O-antigen ligase family protein [Bacteroidales bacterium]|nr:O-antigen ligase family protein [Bacteroidales bacterium]
MVGLCIIAFFLPLSEYITNAAILLIIANFLIEFNFKKKLNRLLNDKTILIFLLVFITHLIWLINSENLDFAFSDIRVKLPLLALPIVIGTSDALSRKKTNLILIIFIVGVLLSSLSGLLSNFGVIFETDTENARNLSIFISHIRLSLMICLSIILIGYFVYEGLIKKTYLKILSVLTAVWFLAFLIMVQGFTGLSSLIIVGLIVFGIQSFKEKARIKRITMISIFFLVPLSLLGYLGLQIHKFYTPTVTKTNFPLFTKNGNAYYHDKESGILENGNLVYVDICEKEMNSVWSTRSQLSLSGNDEKGQVLKHTLIRYLTSKGLRKDAEGIEALSDEDIKHIENGKTNYRFAKHKSLNQRIYNIIWQIDVYSKGGNPSGHSITQRIEYLKYGVILAYRNFWFGTGTGDLDDEFKSLYIERDSQMDPQYRHRAHNQYLTYYISFGIFGTFLCLFAWFYPALIELKNKNFYFIVFFLIAMLSMFTDDTLETTTGVVFVAYFYSLFLWGEK